MPSFEVVDQDGNMVTSEACSFRDSYAELTAARQIL